MELSPYPEMKRPFVLLERCDKIWETLQLIRHMQDETPSFLFDEDDSSSAMGEEADDSQTLPVESKSPTLNEPTNPLIPHIKYQPVLSNGNLALPNFRLSVKSKKRLFQCQVCGQEYRERKNLRTHSERIHGIVLPKASSGRKPRPPQDTELAKNELPKMAPNAIQNSNPEKILSEQPVQNIAQSTSPTKIKPDKPLKLILNFKPKKSGTEQSVSNVTMKIKPGKTAETNISPNAKPVKKDIKNTHTQQQKKSPQRVNAKLTPEKESITSNSESIKCALCHRSYKYIRRHFVEYHKIKYPDVLIKVSEQQSQPQNDVSPKNSDNETETDSPSNLLKREKKHETNVGKYQTLASSQPIEEKISAPNKRKLSISPVAPRKRLRLHNVNFYDERSQSPSSEMECDICLGVYKNERNLLRHRQMHITRGETKQNFNILTSQYKISTMMRSSTNLPAPMTTRSASEISQKSVESKLHSFTEPPGNDETTQLETRKDENGENTCTCGRSFRNAYVLFAHKTNCKTVGDVDIEKVSESRTSSDRDSGIGISITIKKKNDSYEIVSRDSSDDDKPARNRKSRRRILSDETSDVNSGNEDSDDRHGNLVPEASKYSKDHSVMKLELAEEDVDVDIEDDSAHEDSRRISKHGTKNSNTEETTMEEDWNGSSKVEEYEQEVPLLRVLCKNVLIERGLLPEEATAHKCARCNKYLGSKEKLLEHAAKHKKVIGESCACGTKFKSMNAFDAHILEFHPQCITCSFCKERFMTVVAYDEHRCLVRMGPTYNENSAENPCPICGAVFQHVSALLKHIQSEHFDPDAPYQCHKCLEKFPSRVLRTFHINKAHNNKTRCCVCNQMFHSDRMRFKHEAYHRGLGHPCHICKRSYQSKSLLHQHNDAVHNDIGNDEMICVICQKSLKAKSYKRHILRHNSILKCELCDKMLSDSRALELHIMAAHENQDYPRKKCSACGRSFSTKEELEAHIQAHIMEETLTKEFSEGVVKEELQLDS